MPEYLCPKCDAPTETGHHGTRRCPLCGESLGARGADGGLLQRLGDGEDE